MSQSHGGQLAAIAQEFGVDASRLIDFSAGINPDGPPPAVVPALQAALDDPRTFSLYPDLEERELKAAIAAYAAVDPNQIAVSNGFVPLLEAALRAFTIKHCLLPIPSFVEYRRTLDRVAINTTTIKLNPTENFRYPDALTAGEHDAILVANPQNPTGIGTTYEMMLAIVSVAAAQNKLVLLDEAFIDYLPQASLTREVSRFPNLIVFRSVTKFHAMPGMRIAYAVANPDLIAALNRLLPPWPITTLAAKAVCAALPDKPYLARTLERNQGRRAALITGLQALGLTTYPSSANSVLFRVPPAVDATALRQRLILEDNLVLRDCSNYEGLAPNHLRAAVRSDNENNLLLRTLASRLFS